MQGPLAGGKRHNFGQGRGLRSFNPGRASVGTEPNPKTGLMIITCPHCQTKYQVTYEAIGSVGRKVQCAHCSRAWQQAPLPAATKPPAEAADNDRLFDSMAEDALDEVMAEEESQVLAERALKGGVRDVSPPPDLPVAAAPAQAPADPSDIKKREKAFSRRRSEIESRLPLARMRRSARIIAVVLLAVIIALAYFGRVQLVDRYPALAGLYEAVGMGVNVVGLDFSNLTTIKSTSGGQESIEVSAQIVGLSSRPVVVPPVIISLLSDKGAVVYEWSVAPRVPDLMAGERATFETRLTTPPGEAARVRLSFAGGASQSSEAPAPTAAPAEVSQAQAEAAHTPAEAVPAEPAEPPPPAAEAGHGASEEHH